jgi:hypothetical protein
VSLAPGQTAPLQPTAYANVQVRFQPGPSPTGMGAASIGLMPGVDPSTIVLPSRPRAAADVSRPVVEHLPNGATRVLVGTDHMAYTYARRLPSGKLEATCGTNGSHDHSAAPAQKEARK